MTPAAIAILNAASTLGETLFPYVIGLAFEIKQYTLLGGGMSACMLAALAVGVAARRAAHRHYLSRRLPSEFDFLD